MPMKNYHSKSMDRDFPIVYFVGGFINDKKSPTGKPTATASPHGQEKQNQATKPVKTFNKVKGGNTIAEIYARKQELNGKIIRVRGQVTKFTDKIMGKNWLHIRDNSTLDDLTVTTTGSVAAIDDIVIVEGKLELDKDYGYGYVFPLIMQDARITTE
jgi:hypothetical protein